MLPAAVPGSGLGRDFAENDGLEADPPAGPANGFLNRTPGDIKTQTVQSDDAPGTGRPDNLHIEDGTSAANSLNPPDLFRCGFLSSGLLRTCRFQHCLATGSFFIPVLCIRQSHLTGQIVEMAESARPGNATNYEHGSTSLKVFRILSYVIYLCLSIMFAGCAKGKSGDEATEPASSVPVEKKVIVAETRSPEFRDVSVPDTATDSAGEFSTHPVQILPPSTVEQTSAPLSMIPLEHVAGKVLLAGPRGDQGAETGVAQPRGSRDGQSLSSPEEKPKPLLLEVESRSMGEGPVKSGLDVLAEEEFKRLHGKRVALLTNHSAIDREGRHILDLMFGHKNVDLVSLFSPEHGLYGNIDTKTPDAVDTATGLMIHSLYSKRTETQTKPFHPRDQDLAGIDVVIVDMQDIGARYYTYCSYMAYMMESCAPLGVEVMVLDRPNPIGGVYVDGPLLDDDLIGNITTYFKMPIAHGMTMGEMARMFNSENGINCKLSVVEMQNWKRDMYWDETGLRWVNPSPNIQDLDAAIVYPGIAITEALVSMGRGTTEPFHVFGAPFVKDPVGMCRDINTSSGMKGFRLEPFEFTPVGTLARYHAGEKQLCRGARIVITDRKAFRPFQLGLLAMTYLQQHYGSEMIQQRRWNAASKKSVRTGRLVPRYDVMSLRGSCSSLMCARIRENRAVDETLQVIDRQVKQFLPVRQKYLIYQP